MKKYKRFDNYYKYRLRFCTFRLGLRENEKLAQVQLIQCPDVSIALKKQQHIIFERKLGATRNNECVLWLTASASCKSNWLASKVSERDNQSYLEQLWKRFQLTPLWYILWSVHGRRCSDKSNRERQFAGGCWLQSIGKYEKRQAKEFKIYYLWQLRQKYLEARGRASE